MSEQPPHDSEPTRPAERTRLLFAGGLAVALALAVILILVLGGSDPEREFSSPSAACVERWNGDPAAVAFGQHQSGSHSYFEVQVLTLSPDGERELEPGQPGASCAVIFAASALDPEPISAAQILKGGLWTPLSRLSDFARLTALQAEAQQAYNARLTPEGTIEAL